MTAIKRITLSLCLIMASGVLFLLLARQAKGPKMVDFVDKKDGTIYDKRTGLTWMKCSLRQEYHEGSCIEQTKKFNFYEAIAACAELELAGHNNWRLPAAEEMTYLVDCKNYPYTPMPEGGRCSDVKAVTFPTIDIDYFPETRASNYWALKNAHCYYPGEKCVATIDFGEEGKGKLYSNVDPDEDFYVRCVRGKVYTVW